MHHTVSVIICTIGRYKDISEMLDSLVTQTRLPDQLVIVDAGENILEQETLKERIRNINIELIYVSSLPGLTLQRNKGIQEAKGDIIIFFDDDVILEPECINSILRVFEKDTLNEIGAVTGRLTNYNQSYTTFHHKLGRLKKNIFFMGESVGNGNLKLSGLPSLPQMDCGSYIECLVGGCMAFRREAFNILSFDENLNLYAFMEDQDIAKRLSEHYKIYYEPSARVFHKASPDNRLKKYDLARMRVVNHYYLFKKNWPQTFVRKIAFWWSILGWLIDSFSNITNLRGLKGTARGVLDILTGSNKLVTKAKKFKQSDSGNSPCGCAILKD